MSTQQPMGIPSHHSKHLPEIFEQAPTLTSLNSEWSNISLEAYRLPPGETPEFCLSHHVVSISLGKRLQVEQTIEGKTHQLTVLPGMVFICPIHVPHSFYWNEEIQPLSLNLNSPLLNQNSIDLFGTDCVELIPHFAIQDGLIQQIGLRLQAELRSQNSGSYLYAETMANALAVHLLRNYSTQKHRNPHYYGGITQHKLKLVTDYINDNLEQDLRLKDLAAIAQMSQYHFCRVFKQMTGLSPHQYLIQQRVEKAKQLLQQDGMSLGSVAIACGFTHQSHLHRHFKRLTGVTPKTFLHL